MLKRVSALCAAALIAVSAASAYNPPAGGESLYSLVSPTALSGGGSVAGGAMLSVAPESIAFNPALVAGEQRWVVDASGTFLSDFSDNNGGAGQIGLIFPSIYGVAAFNIQGIFVTFDDMDYGNSVTFRGAFAKDLSDELYVGASLEGAAGNALSDGHWGLSAAVGFWYNIKKISWLPFLKDARWGASMTGMGKPYSADGTGIAGGGQSGYPSMFTPRVGVAGYLFDTGSVAGGLSLDFSFPAFQNAVFNAGVEMLFAGIISFKTNWEFNMRETLETESVGIPSVSVGVKFGINAKNEFLSKQGWQQSELVTSAGYKYFDGGYHAVSAGVTAYLGQKDAEAPELKLWAGEKNEEK